MKQHHRALTLFAAASVAAACAPAPRFALRAPVLREHDRLVARRPHASPDANAAYFIDQIALRPLARAFLFTRPTEAHNVNALDEVPDSSWFTNREPAPDEAARGACGDRPAPLPPYTVRSMKDAGATPGFVVRDARGDRYVLKFDQQPRDQPELSTAADAIVSRLYWAVGYFAPCNRVGYVRATDLVLGPGAYVTNDLGHHRPLLAGQLATALTRGARNAAGATRVSVNLFVEGEPLGPWAAEGVRADDPNDVVPHEHRRELRGERLLAAWVNHWDARAPNSFDAFVPAAAPGGGGYVRHYQLDFSDALGARPRDALRWPRQGYDNTVNLGHVGRDLLTLGALHHPWDDDRPDPVVPFLRTNFDVAHFEPDQWRPAIQSPRFDNARNEDMAWMARKIARVTPAHLAAIVAEGGFANPVVARRELELLVGRRERILRWAFARSSPLADVAMDGRGRLCATDLGLRTGISAAATTGFTAAFYTGPARTLAATPPYLERTAAGDGVCATLPPHFAPADAPDDAAARYATLVLDRYEGAHRTQLRAHFYDLGPTRGYVLVGLER